MNTLVMASVAAGLTVIFSAITIGRVWQSGEGPKQELVRGAVIQSALLGLVLGFLLIPHAPPPPAFGADVAWFVAGILAIEVVRHGLYLRLPFAPRSVLRYRLAAMRLKQASVEHAIRQLQELADRNNEVGTPKTL